MKQGRQLKHGCRLVPVAVACAALFCSGPATPDSSVPCTAKVCGSTYTDSTLGFAVSAPTGWSVFDTIPPPDSALIVADSFDWFQAFARINAWPALPGSTYDSLIQVVEGWVDTLGDSALVINSDPTVEIDGKNCAEVRCLWWIGDYSYRGWIFIILNRGSVILVTCVDMEIQYAQSLYRFNEIRSSIQLF